MSNPSPRREVIIADRYAVERKLGAGRVGTVWLVRDPARSERVALKILSPELSSSRGTTALQDEFRAIADLRHPQIAAAYDFGYVPADDLPYYTREYIEGEPLAGGPPRAGGSGDAEPRRFLSPLFDLLDAVEYLHEHEIFHIDIHAGNLIRADDPGRGSVLVDFGWVPRGSSAWSPRYGVTRGASGRDSIRRESPGPVADVYRVGRLLHYRLTGAGEPGARLPREIAGWPARLPLELERIVAKATARDPAHRFRTPRELGDALEASLGEASRRPTPVAEPGEITVGRDEEIERLEGALRGLPEGTRAVFRIGGPLGAGKTRLLTELRRRAQLRGFDTLELRFLPDGSSPPATRQIRRAARRRGRRAPSWVAPLAEERGGTPRDRARRAAEAFLRSDTGPSVFLVDDLDRADPHSRLFIESLAGGLNAVPAPGSGRRGVVLAVTTTEPPAAGTDPNASEERIELGGLPPSQGAALLGRLLRPLSVADKTLARWSRRCRGLPLRLRQIAKLVREAYEREGEVPDVLPAASSPGSPSETPRVLLEHLGEAEARVLEVLAVFAASARAWDVAAAARQSPRTAGAALRRLAAKELVDRSREDGVTRWFVLDRDVAQTVRDRIGAARRRAIHRRAAADIARATRLRPPEMQRWVHHLIALGRTARAREEGLRSARRLRGDGRLQEAARLLEAVLASKQGARGRAVVAEALSDLRLLTGEHGEAAGVLEPIVTAPDPPLEPAAAVRLRGRLGAHYHRSGRPERAVQLFREALARARWPRDREEMVFVCSELAELHTLRGDYDEAEAACRRGLELVGLTPSSRAKEVRRSESVLRGTLGHLELRRLRLEAAREHLEASLRVPDAALTAERHASILNNLGIVHNQLDDYVRARRHYRQAERLMQSCGGHGALIQIACNLAGIAAKRGRPAEARRELRRASRLLGARSGERYELFVEFTRGLVDLFLGDPHTAAPHFEASVPRAEQLGDLHFAGFARVWLGECRLACARYQAAHEVLSEVAGAPEADARQVTLRRMALARRAVVSALVGRADRAASDIERFEDLPGAAVGLLEGLNRIALATACGILGRPEELERHRAEAARRFRGVDVPAARRSLSLLELSRAEARGDRPRVREVVSRLERRPAPAHRLLRAWDALRRAEARAFLGEDERAVPLLEEAERTAVGCPFLECDVRIEHLRARLALRQDDRDAARHHVHRAIQTRDLIAQLAPQDAVEHIAESARFGELAALHERLLQAMRVVSTPPLRGDTTRLVAVSEPMQRVVRSIEAAAPTDRPVLLIGETGTGKEVAARAIHAAGENASGPFEVLACAAVPSELFETEVFGHERGAFTGAETARSGLLEHAAGGTVLFDGLTDLSLPSQAKLLRVLDRKTARRVGSLEERPVDVRLLFTLSGSAQEAIAAGRLRADLYYRLSAFEIALPPLRERPRDLGPLLQELLRRHAKRLGRRVPRVSPAALRRLEAHTWPGNVRELEGLALRLVLERESTAEVSPSELDAFLTPPAGGEAPPRLESPFFRGRGIDEVRRDVERAYLRHLFREHSGHIPSLLEELGVKRSRLYAWLREVGLDVRALRREFEP